MPFDIDLNWPQPVEGPDADVAEVRIAVRQNVMSRLFDADENRTREYFRTSAVSLAFWFADNWWRLRHEPIGDPRFLASDWRLHHEMSSGTSASIWPSLMIYGVGSRVIVSPLLASRNAAGTIRYLADTPQALASRDYEDGVDRLFRSVLDHCALHVDAEALTTLIGQLERERRDDELAGWRRLEACLGYNPDQAPDAVVEAMVALEEEVGEAAIDEAAIGHPGPRAAEALSAMLEAARASEVVADLSAVHDAFGADTLPDLAPWQAAEEAALHLRDVLNIGETVLGADFSDMLRTRWDDLKTATATARDLPYGGAAEERHGQRLALQMKYAVDRRFELGRFIGDEVWRRGRGLGIVSRGRSDRQKFQRAFAQTLLCPMFALRRTVDLDQPTPEQIDAAARRFGVRSSVIATILVNRGYLPRETIADWLEAA